ncbi:MAG: PocR ligand-binding domain-containing protein [Deltaproteobacteria bacterium]|nr:PocR ligand-binding domain-containing protein [Deltaproteobacteria bacterium]
MFTDTGIISESTVESATRPAPSPEENIQLVQRLQSLEREIAERRHAQESLAEENRVLKSILDGLPVPLFVKDVQGIYRHVNRAYQMFHGRKKEEVIGRTVYDLYPQILADKYTDMDHDLAKQSIAIQEYDYETMANGGYIRDVTKIKAPWLDRQGQYQGLIGVIFDITERLQTEAALVHAKEEWERTFDAVPDLIAILDCKCHLIRANRALLQRLGLDLAQVVGRSCFELFERRREICDHCPQWRVVKDEQEYAVEIYLKQLDGDFLISVSPLYGPGDKLDGTVLIAHDITGRRQAEDDLKRAREELEQKVRERTAKLAASNEELKIEITERKSSEEAFQNRLLALTKPGNIPESIEFTDLFTVQEIQAIQDAFANATNLASIITHPDGRPITEPSNFCRICQDIIRPSAKGGINCMRSDAILGRPNPHGPVISRCLSSGLWDGGASISVGDKHVANWLIGQVRDASITEEHIRQYAREIEVDEDQMAEALTEVPVMPPEQFAQVCRALFLFANQMSELALQNVLQARSIMARQQAEEALRQSEARLQLLSAKLIMAQEEERRKLAADLHDGIGQSLAATKYGVDSVLPSLPNNTPAQESLRAASSTLKDVINEVRRMQTELRPQVLDDLGIVATVNWFCREYQKIYSRIIVEKNIKISENAIPAKLKPVIYRIMQEAMNNVAKHSQATRVTLGLRQKAGKITLSIQDDGLGFNAARILANQDRQYGLGLDSMRERADLSGGRLTIKSLVNKGTVVRVSWRAQ